MPTRYFRVDTLDERINVRGLAEQLRAEPETSEVGLTYFHNDRGRPPYMRLMVVRDDFSDYGLMEEFNRRGTENPPRSPDEIRADEEEALRLHRQAEEEHTTRQEGETQGSWMERILRNAMRPAGRSRLGAAMMAPIRARLDYQGIARRALVVDPLPEGALPLYDRDINVTPEFALLDRDITVTDPPFSSPEVIRSPLVPRGMIYATTEPEEFGRIPVRTELTVLPADNPRPIGWRMMERVGQAVFNPRGLERMGVRTAPVVTTPQVFELPKWAVPGTWIWNQFTDRFARIIDVQSYMVWVENWRAFPATAMINSTDIHMWAPCNEPRMPAPWHERLDFDLV